MSPELKILNMIYFDEFPNKKLIKLSSNTLRSFAEDFIDGPFIDIGCGQSSFIVEHALAKTDRIIYGIDEEKSQLKNLMYRLRDIPDVDLNNKIKLELKSFPKDKLPEEVFSVVVLSNFLHFFTLEGCNEIVEILKNHTTKGSLIYVVVHSKKYSSNQ